MPKQTPILSRSAKSNQDSALKLGGITVFGKNEIALLDGIRTVADAIGMVSRSHLTLTRTNLRCEVRKLFETEIDDRVFSGILGSELRKGAMDSLVCAAASGKTYRILVHAARLSEFDKWLADATRRLRTNRVIQVRDVEQMAFGSRRWGTWSSALHILTRAVRLGRACYVDDMTFAWPRGIDNAVG